MPSTSLVLTPDQRSDLEARVRSGRGRADAARRARVILLLADGCSYATIVTMTGCSSRTIALWKQRFVEDGVAGLAARPHAPPPTPPPPAGPGPAVVARARRTARLRVLPTRDTVPLCGAEHTDGRSGGPHRGSSHERGIRRLSADGRRDAAPTARDAHHCGQSLGPQDAAGPDLLGGASVRPSPLHTDLFVLAQSSRTLVLQDRARCHGAGHRHLRHRPAPQADALYQALQQDGDADPLGLRGPVAENRMTAVQLVSTVH